MKETILQISRKLQGLGLSAAILLGIACAKWSPSEPTSDTRQETPQAKLAPVVQIEVGPTIRMDRPLVAHWKITNNRPISLYVYSTPFQHPASADIAIDSASRAIEIRCLRLQPLPVGINAFPEAEFMDIPSGQSREGSFASYLPIDKLVTYKSVGDKTARHTITKGVWKIELLLAFGEEIDSVKRDLAESLRQGKEHPINPITRWQRVAYSNPVSITIGK